MLRSILFVIFVLCSGLKASPISIHVNTEEIKEKFEPIFESRCLKNADANAYRQLETSRDNLKYCVARNSRPSTSQADAFNTLCNEARRAVYNCLQDYFKKLEPCLDPQEKYLPNFFLGAHNRTFDQACGNFSRLQDIFASLGSVQCDLLPNEVGQLMVAYCLPKVRSLKMLSDSDYLLTKSNVCGDLKTIKRCVANVIKSNCTHGEALLELLTSSIDPYLVPCDASMK